MAETRTRSAMSITIFDLDCCPHCRGKGGFTYRAVTRGVQFRSWDGESNFFEDTSTSHGAYRCDDCGKIIRQKDIPQPQS